MGAPAAEDVKEQAAAKEPPHQAHQPALTAEGAKEQAAALSESPHQVQGTDQDAKGQVVTEVSPPPEPPVSSKAPQQQSPPTSPTPTSPVSDSPQQAQARLQS